MKNWRNAIPFASLGLAMAACVFAAFAFRAEPKLNSDIEDRVYMRIVADVANELGPVYRDLGVKMPENVQTLTELIRPLVSVSPNLAQLNSYDADSK